MRALLNHSWKNKNVPCDTQDYTQGKEDADRMKVDAIATSNIDNELTPEEFESMQVQKDDGEVQAQVSVQTLGGKNK